MSLKKKYLKSRPVCKVTFRIPKEAAGSSETANLAGEFNDWDIHSIPMQHLKNGDFTITLDLDTNREYQYRYLLNKTIWITDYDADKRVPTPYGDSENSVVVV